ncbi:DUF92 domain-containing protein [uncultured Mucilaginibacter sp.]|uniref:DUF92 domain-containing protein n=1 Tax=uncultured Mucilaginibacter sp. TaxID=797541 RepID=UPI00262F38F0|nr:DUF92 domain-containing protein [uncultured Mucilaginibacter sp.]
MQTADYFLPIILLTGVVLSVKSHKLTLPAALTAAILGVCLYLGAGYFGILMAAVLFLMATVATAQKSMVKEALFIAEKNQGQRTAGQVLANVGMAGLMGLLCFFYPAKIGVLRLMMAASLASAAADTVSSELGTVYGRHFYNIISLKPDQRGLDGVISLEGTLCGFAASVIIATVYALSFGWNLNFWWIIIAGTVGNLADSVLGATLERKGYLGNNAVNFLNTVVAALVSMMLFLSA